MIKQCVKFLLPSFMLLALPCWAQTYPATDSFSGSGALSSNWIQAAPTGLSFPPVALLRSSGTVVPTPPALTTSSWGLALYSGEMFNNDQYAQVTFVAHSTGSHTGPCVLMSSVGSGYCYSADLGVIYGYSNSLIDSTPVTGCPIPASGDTIELSTVGSTLTCKDVTAGTSASGPASPGYHTSGMPGVLVDQTTSAGYALTSFQADCIPTCGSGGTVATPTFSPVGGTYTSTQAVTISDATSGATIYYTTNGSTPTTSSTTYSAPISVSASGTIKALGVLSGLTNSTVASATYVISGGYPATDSFSGSGALSSNWTQPAPTGLSFPPVALLRSSGTVVPTPPALTTSSWGLALYTGVTFSNDQYAQVVFIAHSTSSHTGPCVLMSSVDSGYCYAADDGVIYGYSNGLIDTTPVTGCPVPASGDTIALSTVGSTLTCTDVTAGTSASGPASPGYHPNGAPGVLVDQTNSAVYALTAFQADCIPTCGSGSTVATPTFSPAGGTYSSAQTITISDATSGATIYYTTNGSTPTTSSAIYSTPITVSSSETIKAIGVLSGSANSAVASATYTLVVATPTFSPSAGTYSSPQTVTVSDATSGATIYYTTDGSTPTTSSTTYSSPINVSTSETVKAIGVLSGYTNSAVASAAYTIGSGHTWYIRHDGGDNIQCTGTTNAAYPGSGTGMPCAYNHPYQMLAWNGNWTAFAPGDTMQFADPPSNTVPYYMGEQNGGLGMDWQPTVGGICPAPNSSAAAGAACWMPILPDNTTIKGQNFGHCHKSDHTGLDHPTVLSGINGIEQVLFVDSTQGVTISCIEITQPDTCTNSGTGHGGGQCTSTSNFVNAAGLMLEFATDQGPANMTLTDFAAIGLAHDGIIGSHLNRLSTDVFNASDIYIIGNGLNGWDGDGGGCGTSCESVGTMNVSYLDAEWNGCMAVKPYDVGLPPELNANGFNFCYGQNTSGSGDGFVQIAAGNLTLNMDHSKFKYNTQDGFDGAHLSDDATTTPATNVTNSWSEGNAGQTFKIGAGASSTAINNVSIGNCRILSDPTAFPNNPSGWILDPGDDCRSSGDQWSLTLRDHATVTLENNSSAGYGATMYDLQCGFFFPTCSANGAQVIFTNNVSKGYPDPGNSGIVAAGFFLGSGVSASSVTGTFNLWNTMRGGCPDHVISDTNFVCADPLWVAESNVDAINPNLTSSSPAIGAGTPISGITTDYNGATRPNPPSIGAFQ